MSPYGQPNSYFIGRVQPGQGFASGSQVGMPRYGYSGPRNTALPPPPTHNSLGNPTAFGRQQIAEQRNTPSLWDSMFGGSGGFGGGGMGINPGPFTGLSPTDLSGARAQINPRMMPGVPIGTNAMNFTNQQMTDQSRTDREAADLDLARRGAAEGGRLDLTRQIAQSDNALRLGDLFRRLNDLNLSNADFGAGLLFNTIGNAFG